MTSIIILTMGSIVEYRKNGKNITVPDEKVVYKRWNFMWPSTVRWKLWVQWRDFSVLWRSHKDLKECYPVETVEDAVAQEIYHDPAFNWWVNTALKKMLHIISLLKKRNSRYLKKYHEFGIEVPKSVTQSYDLDEKNGSTLWGDSIYKEMKYVSPPSVNYKMGYCADFISSCEMSHGS